jgi:hypothetical protein
LMKASVMAVLAACEVHGNAEGTPNRISSIVCTLAWSRAILSLLERENLSIGL